MSQDGSGPTSVATAKDVRAFFRDALDETLSRQKVSVREETEAYLVNLLVEFVAADQLFVRETDGTVQQEPLAFMLKRAIEAPRPERAKHLKKMGDTALYVSGFFSDSLARSLVDVDYYASMGGRAYDALSGMVPARHAAAVFGELAAKFLQIADTFSAISEQGGMTSNAGILRLYERYVKTGSERLRALLAEKGVLAIAVAPESVQ